VALRLARRIHPIAHHKNKTPELQLRGFVFLNPSLMFIYAEAEGAELRACAVNDVPQYAQFTHPAPSFLWHTRQVRINSAPHDGQNVNDCAESLLHFGHGVGNGSRNTK
jgi:hypothetical protein